MQYGANPTLAAEIASLREQLAGARQGLTQSEAQRLATARNAALEEAAAVCEQYAYLTDARGAFNPLLGVATKIRTLKS